MTLKVPRSLIELSPSDKKFEAIFYVKKTPFLYIEFLILNRNVTGITSVTLYSKITKLLTSIIGKEICSL